MNVAPVASKASNRDDKRVWFSALSPRGCKELGKLMRLFKTLGSRDSSALELSSCGTCRMNLFDSKETYSGVSRAQSHVSTGATNTGTKQQVNSLTRIAIVRFGGNRHWHRPRAPQRRPPRNRMLSVLFVYRARLGKDVIAEQKEAMVWQKGSKGAFGAERFVWHFIA